MGSWSHQMFARTLGSRIFHRKPSKPDSTGRASNPRELPQEIAGHVAHATYRRFAAGCSACAFCGAARHRDVREIGRSVRVQRLGPLMSQTGMEGASLRAFSVAVARSASCVSNP